MYEIEISDDLWKTIFTYLATLSWPLIVLIIVCILRWPIASLISRIKKIEGAGWKFEIGDAVKAYSPEDKAYYSVPLQLPPTPALKIVEAKAISSRLSDKEIEESREKALKRLKEDTEIVGFPRGKLFQHDNGRWGIIWEVAISDNMTIKG